MYTPIMQDDAESNPDDYIRALTATLRELLREQTDGIGEYELLQLFREQGYFSFLGNPPALPADIFRAHFILFHALYHLRDRLLQDREAWLEIGPLNIQLQTYQAASAALTETDELRSYYLNWDNLQQTSAEDVFELLASFWRRLAQPEQRRAALAELGLRDPVDTATIRQTYRRLVMIHHPDRGGDKQRLQAINRAMDLLLR